MPTIAHILFRQAQINHVDSICFFTPPHEKVVGFYVSMKKLLCMKKLDPLQQLISEQEDSFKGELSVGFGKQILQAGPQEVHQHDIVRPLCGHGIDLSF